MVVNKEQFDIVYLIITITGGMDESICLTATDSDSNSYEWCTIGNYSFCLIEKQDTITKKFGTICDNGIAMSDIKNQKE